MSETDLDARLDAVERALTDGETDLADLQDAAALAERVDALEARVADLEETVADLDAAVQAVRGYAGNVRAVNRDVERRASAALAKAEAIERALDDGSGASVAQANRDVSADQAQIPNRDDTSPGASHRRPGPGERESGDDRRVDGVAPCEAADQPREQARDTNRSASGNAGAGRHEGNRTDDPAQSRATGRSDRATTDDAPRSVARDESQSDDGTSARTEQFIERVRNAL